MPPFLLLLSFSLLISTTLTTSCSPDPKPEPNDKYTSFVKSACKTTTYPTLCLKTCLPYAGKIKGSPQKLVVAAISATLAAAQSSATAAADLSRRSNLGKYEAAAMGDCIVNMGDSIDDLKQSIEEINDFRSSEDMKFKISNVQTWMSAAISNEDTCMDAIREHRVDLDVKRKIRGSILEAAKLTSNALSLCNHLQYY